MLLAVVAIPFLLLHFEGSNLGLEEKALENIEFFFFLLLAAVGVIAAIRILYLELYRFCYDYRIHAGQFIVEKGIVLRERGSFPVIRITDVYLDRCFTDFIFGLYNVHVSTPTAHSGQFARIDGLSKATAISLQSNLMDIIQQSNSRTKQPSTAVNNNGGMMAGV